MHRGETHELFSTADDEELSAPVTILVPGEAALGEGRITASLQITTAPPEVDGQQTGEGGTALQPALARTTVAVLLPPRTSRPSRPGSISASSRRRRP